MILAHTVVLLGDVRLSEKDAAEKIKEYRKYIEEKKEKYILSRSERLDRQHKTTNLQQFQCQECNYSTICRRNWWQHTQTQRHKSLFT